MFVSRGGVFVSPGGVFNSRGDLFVGYRFISVSKIVKLYVRVPFFPRITVALNLCSLSCNAFDSPMKSPRERDVIEW